MKRWETLGVGEYGIWQDDALGCFTGDAVLLAHFLRVDANDRVLDIGTGGGILSLYGNALYGASFTGIDTNGELIALARESAARNGQNVSFLVLDAAKAPELLSHGAFTACVCNPPYFASGDRSPNPARASARHASLSQLDMFLHTAFLLLKNGGSLFLCYPAMQLTDVVCALRHNRIEPKRMQFVQSGGVPRLLLIEAKKLAKPGLRMETCP